MPPSPSTSNAGATHCAFAGPRDAVIARLRAKCAAFAEENEQLRALASRLSSVESGKSGESSERKICAIAETRDEGAGAKRARDEDARNI